MWLELEQKYFGPFATQKSMEILNLVAFCYTKEHESARSCRSEGKGDYEEGVFGAELLRIGFECY